MTNFKERVLMVVAKIPKGKVMIYKKVAKLAGKPRAYRAVGNILSKNYNSKIPCHRVIRSDREIGGYNRGINNKIIKILKDGGVGVLPTDTIYGLVGSALNKKTVRRIYKLRQRNPKKPLIILINSLNDLKLFNIKIDAYSKKILDRVWPGKVSVILPCPDNKFFYLHRGTKTLAFRLPAKIKVRNLLKKTGPLVAPSANPEGLPTVKTIKKAKKYFGKNIDFYINEGKLESLPSTLIRIKNRKITILRQGEKKIDSIVNKL